MHRMALAVMLLSMAAPAAAQPIGPAEADRLRIGAHLAEVEAELRAVDTDHLTADRRAARGRALDALHEYRLSGEFPRNEVVPNERVPVFIDDADRRCAMAHLVIESGGEAVARGIAATQNTARVTEMESPALAQWLVANGLSLQEAQRIQPSYCFCDAMDAPVCGEDGRTYLNQCVAETCSGVTVASAGACPESTEPPIEGCICEESGGGCAVAPVGRSGALFGCLLVALGLVLARRRR